MTLDEAIKHCEEVAQENEKQFNNCPMKYDGAYANNGQTACKCAEEHRQIAEWLKELKQLREQTRWIPVSERLPEEDCETYLVCCANGYIASIMYDRYLGWLLDDDIVAWMPLPQPYMAESEDKE